MPNGAATELTPLLDGSTAGELIPELVRRGLQQLIELEVWASPAFSDSPSGPHLTNHTGSLSPFFVLDGAEVLQE